MSADTVIFPRRKKVSASPPKDLRGAGADAVDVFEIAARLEASGLSDSAAARRHGVTDVFELAVATHDPHRQHAPRTHARGWFRVEEFLRAGARAIMLLLGAVLSGLSQHVLDPRPHAMMIAGVVAWVTGQAVAGVAWGYAGVGRGELALARGVGAALAIGAGLIAPVTVLATTDILRWDEAVMVLAWFASACSMSLLVIVDRFVPMLGLMTAATLVSACAAVALEGVPELVVVIGSAAAVPIGGGALVLKASPDSRTPRRPTAQDWVRAISPSTQATGLAVALFLAVRLLPPADGAAMVTAGIAAAAVSDPALVAVRQRLTWISQRTRLLAHAARRAQTTAVLLLVGISGLSGSIAAVVSTDTERGALTAIVAAAFSSLATTSAALMAFGKASASVVVAAMTAGSAVAWAAGGDWVAATVTLAALAVGGLLLLARLADPRAYA